MFAGLNTAQANKYTQHREFMKKVRNQQGVHYVLFSGHWCPPCKKLIRLLKQAEILDKIMVIDVSKNFGMKLMYDLKIPGIPAATTVTTVRSGKTPQVMISKDYKYGLNKCLIFLLAKVRKSKPKK